MIQLELNPRTITEEKRKKLIESLEKFNLVEIPAVNTDMQIIGGNQRVTALIMVGRGEDEIDVRYPNRRLTKKEVKEYTIISNTHAGEFDFDMIDLEFSDVIDDIGFDDWKTEMEASLSNEVKEDNYEIPEDIETDIVLGDLFEIGEHRLLCGDSTDSDQVDKLMNGEKGNLVVTDPPYNTGMKPNKDAKAWLSHMFSDSFTDEEWDTFLIDIINNYNLFTNDDSVLYVFIDWRRVSDIKIALERIAQVKNVIVWDKGVHGLGSDYKSTYENCVVAKKGKPEINNKFELDYQDIWRVKRAMGRVKEHATQKPIELLAKPIKHASKINEIVIDLFIGSGSTMVAAHELRRKCYAMEKEPKYCQVTIERMLKLDSSLTILRNGKPWNIQKK